MMPGTGPKPLTTWNFTCQQSSSCLARPLWLWSSHRGGAQSECESEEWRGGRQRSEAGSMIERVVREPASYDGIMGPHVSDLAAKLPCMAAWEVEIAASTSLGIASMDDTYRIANFLGLIVDRIGKSRIQTANKAIAARFKPPKIKSRSHRLTRSSSQPRTQHYCHIFG